MKTRLDQITVSGFVSLLCGDYAPLLEKGDKPSQEEANAAAKAIILEYREISDSAGMKAYLLGMERMARARSETLMFSVCRSLCDMEKYADVKAVFEEYGLNTARMSETRLKAEASARYEKARNAYAKLAEESASDGVGDVRREFAGQTASLMAHFKFQIDEQSMNASVYAHLIARFREDMKVLAALSKKK